jgi:hypothetical protein
VLRLDGGLRIRGDMSVFGAAKNASGSAARNRRYPV